jgi:hypothetical protein
MNEKQLKDLRHNEELRKRLAKFMALNCFRNTELENLHGAEPKFQGGGLLGR